MHHRGFTLTELLIVVVIIGTLAAIVQPKFQNVVDTYRALEAEHVMASVRSEQTARCTLDKDYATEPQKLVSMPAHTSFNFAYQLTGTGIRAISLIKNYTLVMKSYQHGGICCQAQTGEGAGDCENLMRNYPLCSEYNVTDQTGCGVPDEDSSPEPDPGTDEGERIEDAISDCYHHCETITFTCVEEDDYFVRMIIEGDYEILEGDLESPVITVRPEGDIKVQCVFRSEEDYLSL